MNTINSTGANYLDFTQKAIRRNTATEVIEAKQSGEAINKEEIKQSNAEIKDKSIKIASTVYQAQYKKNAVDSYISSSAQAKETYSSEPNNSADSTDVYTFDPQKVNEINSTVQKRAAGIAVYEKVMATKQDNYLA